MERRKIQRIEFSEPINARLGVTTIKLYDLSLTGASVLTRNAHPVGRHTTLTFNCSGERIEAEVAITRCRLIRDENGSTGFDCGMRFVEMTPETRASISKIIAQHVKTAIQKRKESRRETANKA